MLPEQFLCRMEIMLGEEYEDFLDSYEKEGYRALRFNILKGGEERLLDKLSFLTSRVPWEKNGFYYPPGEQPGKHPYHAAGVYYIQEPSAMAPVGWLEPQPGERILDLCAAPGGKSTQIATGMKGEGILICNEIHPCRARILSENIERMGIRNGVVMNETPEKLAEYFPGYFDRILVDAPCSGEGMFRKNVEACDEWSPDHVRMCAARQDEILELAAGMLRPGGRLVYSTCTFAPDENEGTIYRFLQAHPDFFILKVDITTGMSDGLAEWAKWTDRMEEKETVERFVWMEGKETAERSGRGDEHKLSGRLDIEGLERTIRLWPHKVKGEGHYAAVLQKGNEGNGICGWVEAPGAEAGIREKELGEFPAFCRDTLKTNLSGKYLKFGEQLYLVPEDAPAFKGLRVLRPGLHLGTMKKNRFEPSHALAITLKPEDVVRSWDLPSEGKMIRDYLRGQAFPAAGEKGWYLITVDGYSVGWGKLAGGMMKNHYPKGLRIG